MKRGFTLVELSIVLVIIGLIAGGILAAKSMIETAKISRLAQDLQKYSIAINNFNTNYSGLPGDSPLFVPPGNGDGVLLWGGDGVPANCADAPYAPLSKGEAEQAWAHLSQAGMIDKKFVNVSPKPTCVGGIHDVSQYYSVLCKGDLGHCTEIDSRAYRTIVDNGYAPSLGKLLPIQIMKQADENMSLYVQVPASQIVPLENKLSTSNGQTPGVKNEVAPGRCYSMTYDNVSCYDANAGIGRFQYFIFQ